MSRKLAIKRLTQSDLTFFEWQFKNRNAGNQKAINLNADVFVSVLYPGLAGFDPSIVKKFPIDVFVYGPGLQKGYNIQRKIVKSGGSKNWRLNGEFVYNPENSPQRFNPLTSGDFAIFDFGGEVAPETVSIVFIANSVSEDKNIHNLLDGFLGTQKMAAISPLELENLIQRANPLKEHSLYSLTLEADTLSPEIEDIALGGSQGKGKLLSRVSNRKISREALQKAKENADLVGLNGEQFINSYLSKLKDEGEIQDFEWTSIENSISPYDFWISKDGSSKIFVDVKSTQGDFERSLHVSLNELRQMKLDNGRYDLYRVFRMEENTAQLRIAEDVREFAKKVLDVLDNLPTGISADSISFPSNANILTFAPPITITRINSSEE